MQEDRPEVKAWTNLISMKQIPENKKEVERLAALQAQELDNQKKKKRGGSSKSDAKKQANVRLNNNNNANSKDINSNQHKVIDINPFEMQFLTLVDL